MLIIFIKMAISTYLSIIIGISLSSNMSEFELRRHILSHSDNPYQALMTSPAFQSLVNSSDSRDKDEGAKGRGALKPSGLRHCYIERK